jgi:Mn-dependent DtxR family transcriptional regulator
MKHYIKAIYELSDDGMGVRISDIAAKVGVTKASSCIAMKILQEKEMVYRDVTDWFFLQKKVNIRQF